MKRLLVLSIAVLFGTSAAVRAQEKTDPLYPLKVGSVWTYKVSGGSIQVKVEKKEKFGDEETYKLVTSAQGKEGASEHVAIKDGKDGGVYRYDIGGVKPDAPLKFLALPATKSTKWTVNSKIGKEEVSGEFVIKEEDVTVPAGVYKAATLVEGANFKLAGYDSSIKTWYVKDIGIVKMEFKLGGQDATFELEKYEPGK